MVFPSLKAKQLLRALKRKPLKYKEIKTTGSHRKLQSDSGYPDINFCFHDKDTIPPGLVRQILVDRAGLTQEQALEILK